MFIQENVTNWLRKEMYASGHPEAWLWHVQQAIEELEEELEELENNEWDDQED